MSWNVAVFLFRNKGQWSLQLNYMVYEKQLWCEWILVNLILIVVYISLVTLVWKLRFPHIPKCIRLWPPRFPSNLTNEISNFQKWSLRYPMVRSGFNFGKKVACITSFSWILMVERVKPLFASVRNLGRYKRKLFMVN